MPALDFPNSPTTGQIMTGPGGVGWKWDGAKWISSLQYSPLGTSSLATDTLTVTATNVLSSLSFVPDGHFIVLYANRTPFFAVGSTPDFSFSGTTITWLSTLYSLAPGEAVEVTYSH